MKEILEEKYCLKINSIQKNKDSTDGNVYIINCDNKKYILKIYNDKTHVENMVNIHTYLNKNGIYVPKIILTNNNKMYVTTEKNKYAVIYSFLDGKKIKDIELNEEVSKIIAKELKKMHEVTNNNSFCLNYVPFSLKNSFDRKSVLHFDLTNCNIFYKDKEKTVGFIDFDDAKYGPSILDVAILCSLLYFSKTKGVNQRGLKAFINEYYKGTEYKEEIKYLKECASSWIDYILQNNNLDTSDKESFEVRKSLMEEFFV